MGFLKSLFGVGKSNSEQLTLEDNEFGWFTAIHDSGDKIIWKGSIDFSGENIELFIHGSREALNAGQKNKITALLNNETVVAGAIDTALREQYDNADKEYTGLKEHFTYVSISSTDHDITITLEEKESFYQFNVQLINNQVADVSIDS